MGVATVCGQLTLGALDGDGLAVDRTSTPAGTAMGSLPIRDMCSPPGLPHVGEDFPAHALLVGLTVREQTGGGGQDGDAEAAEHPGISVDFA